MALYSTQPGHYGGATAAPASGLSRSNTVDSGLSQRSPDRHGYGQSTGMSPLSRSHTFDSLHKSPIRPKQETDQYKSSRYVRHLSILLKLSR